ncbi:glyoxylate reductase/hydroxypyruvate reductase-like [Mizuhopecten yessoensis]|uniref:Glyoxylate reductase/hydroxypyruvate reductase n=1 Tax=Mizuhopecten yessoensis TaxID=6573 RepID=A0A210Q5T5_MIZYE|nr:glyoxylate reductase/hydroxypyruvate reductase-like [Mizuhopecten yessoensis]OWF44097.1 Glyoxylate reductase/hydroxypyruvate reductase [Mizuhopecten yessoensis]
MKPRPKVYITYHIPQKGIDTLLKACNVAIWDGNQAVPRGELVSMVKGVDAIWCTAEDKIDRELLESAGPNLKVVGTISEDLGHIDTEECHRLGIKIATPPKVSMETVVDLTIAILLQATSSDSPTKLIPEVTDANQNHMVFPGKTLGIVGFGNVGHAVAKRLSYMGVNRIMYNDISEVPAAGEICAEYCSFEKLLEESDILCLSCKPTTQSWNLFNKDAFKRMKNSAILIDASRGHTINYADLYEALRKGDIYAAGLDVREEGQISFKAPLQGLNNCHFFPYQEVNHTWDNRSRNSGVLAQGILAMLTNNS